MTSRDWEIVAEVPQLFPRGLGEAVAKMARARWPRDTAKHIARAWGLDPKTAENVTRGHVSERTISKAIKAEGWGLLAPLGEVLTGQTFEQHLQTLIAEADDARHRIEARCERVRGLSRQAAGLDHLQAGPGAGGHG